MRSMLPNDQLTDGGPSLTPELPDRVAGPPFGEAFGSVILSFSVWLRTVLLVAEIGNDGIISTIH